MTPATRVALVASVLALVVAVVAVFAVPGSAAAAAKHRHRHKRLSPVMITVLSNRADLISGANALVVVTLPPRAAHSRVRILLGRRNVRAQFSLQVGRRLERVLTGLHVGRNMLSVRLRDRTGARITITNHPIGGPVFSGPQPAGANPAKPHALTTARTQTTAKTITIGYSVDHRPITAVVLGPDSAPRKVLLVGCIHGNECAGLRILGALRSVQPAVGVQLWLVGKLNPDGTAEGTRQNAHGVDLNRNFPYQWERVTDPIYYSGHGALSEPESRAAVKLIRRIRPAVTVWYHQHEDLVDMAGGDRGVARRYAQLAHLRATCLPFLPGTAPGWSNHTFPGTTSFVVELPPGPVGNAALSAHRRAVSAAERGKRSGSHTSCAP